VPRLAALLIFYPGIDLGKMRGHTAIAIVEKQDSRRAYAALMAGGLMLRCWRANRGSRSGLGRRNCFEVRRRKSQVSKGRSVKCKTSLSCKPILVANNIMKSYAIVFLW
jgi:hypothetical protein